MQGIKEILGTLEARDRELALIALKNLKSSGFFTAAVKVTRESVLVSWSRGADQFDLLKRINETNMETQLYEALEEASTFNPST